MNIFLPAIGAFGLIKSAGLPFNTLYAVINVAPHIQMADSSIPPIDITGFSPMWKFGSTNRIPYITNIKYGIKIKPSTIPIVPPIRVASKENKRYLITSIMLMLYLLIVGITPSILRGVLFYIIFICNNI